MTPVTRTSDFADAVIVYGVLTGQLPTREAVACLLRPVRECSGGVAHDSPLVERASFVRRTSPHLRRDGGNEDR